MQKELREAVIVSLVKNAQTRRLGKIQLQKLVYFAQNCGLPLKYTYEIYHYGPYSFELSHDLGSLDSLGILNIENDPNGFGFDISAGKFAEKFQLETKHQKIVDKIISQFGSYPPAKLEVEATIHFVYSVVRKGAVSTKTRSEIIRKVQALKPRFSEAFIKNCYSDLEKMDWL